MARSRSSGRWLSEHFSDEYVKQAQTLGYRSRAVFKLKELDEREGLLRPGMVVVDLGAAPGGWSQYAAKQIGNNGKIIALDLLPVEEIPNVTFIQGDFRDDAILTRLMDELAGRPVDLVMSDMAPNMSGNRVVDQARGMHLAELALETVRDVLKPGGLYVTKLFQGPDVDLYVKSVRELFVKVSVRKPKASRDRSPEVYLVARGRRQT
ncbi:MAG: 23S rRNA (uridine(2552)-2'-O)-methyltransferase RlmE [Methylococcaceae bacterium]|jgi:23S rRNA (uridine2552-2'-O)-methyltransferase